MVPEKSWGSFREFWRGTRLGNSVYKRKKKFFSLKFLECTLPWVTRRVEEKPLLYQSTFENAVNCEGRDLQGGSLIFCRPYLETCQGKGTFYNPTDWWNWSRPWWSMSEDIPRRETAQLVGKQMNQGKSSSKKSDLDPEETPDAVLSTGSRARGPDWIYGDVQSAKWRTSTGPMKQLL